MASAPPDDDEEDLVFNVEEIQKIIRDNIELILGGNIYSHSRSPQWIGLITDKTMARIAKLNKPFKYILRITITQKNGSGLHTAAAYYWDTVTDGTCTVRWENNKHVQYDIHDWHMIKQIDLAVKLIEARDRFNEVNHLLAMSIISIYRVTQKT